MTSNNNKFMQILLCTKDIEICEKPKMKHVDYYYISGMSHHNQGVTSLDHSSGFSGKFLTKPWMKVGSLGV